MFFFILFYSKVIFGKFLFWLARDRDNRRRNNNPYNSFKHVTGSLCFGQREITNPFFFAPRLLFSSGPSRRQWMFCTVENNCKHFRSGSKSKVFFYKQTRGKKCERRKIREIYFQLWTINMSIIARKKPLFTCKNWLNCITIRHPSERLFHIFWLESGFVSLKI